MIHCAGNCKQGDAPCNCKHEDALAWVERAHDLGHTVLLWVSVGIAWGVVLSFALNRLADIYLGIA